jgi:hypothetical protein
LPHYRAKYRPYITLLNLFWLTTVHLFIFVAWCCPGFADNEVNEGEPVAVASPLSAPFALVPIAKFRPHSNESDGNSRGKRTHSIGFVEGVADGPFAIQGDCANGPALCVRGRNEVIVCPCKVDEFVCLRFVWLGHGSQNRPFAVVVPLAELFSDEAQVQHRDFYRLQQHSFLPLTKTESDRLTAITPRLVLSIAELFCGGQVPSGGRARELRSAPSKVQRFSFSPTTPRVAKIVKRNADTRSPRMPPRKQQRGWSPVDAPRKLSAKSEVTPTAPQKPYVEVLKTPVYEEGPHGTCVVDVRGLGSVARKLLAAGATEVNLNLGSIIVKK